MNNEEISRKSGFTLDKDIIIGTSWQTYYHPGLYLEPSFEEKYDNDTGDSETSEETLGDNEIKLYPPIDITELVVCEVYQFRCETGKNFNFWNLINVEVDPEEEYLSGLIPSGDNPFDLYIDGIEGNIKYFESGRTIREGNLVKFSLYINIDYPEGRAGAPTIQFYVDPNGKIVDNNVEFNSTDSR